MTLDRSQLRHAWWLVVATLVGGVHLLAACGSDGGATDNGAGATVLGADASFPSSSSGGSSGATSGSSGTTSSGGSSGGSSGTTDGGSSGAPDPKATPPNFKVAFIGDTDNGTDFKSVLALIKREKAQAVFIQGDIEYGGNTAPDWFPVIDAELQAGATKIPYFVSRGNHDDDWTQATGLGTGLDKRLTDWGITPDHNKPTLNNYSFTYKGLKVVMVHESETNPTRANYVKDRLAGDTHYWKICSWHKNMRDTNVGPKGDEMGWTIYENCRAAGAMVAQGHSHTYSRSKTMTADQALTVDPACNDPFALCVGPNKHFFFDSSVGGVDLRTLQETNKPHWASTYAGDFGALFIEFNVDGDPKKAKGYFMNVANQIIDPPSGSGKTFFTITSTN